MRFRSVSGFRMLWIMFFQVAGTRVLVWTVLGGVFLSAQLQLTRYILGTIIPSLAEEDRAGVLPESSEYKDQEWPAREGSLEFNKKPL